MTPPTLSDHIYQFVEKNIDGFHKRRLERLKNLKLNEVLKRKNPYLFKAKNLHVAHDLVKMLLDAFLSSHEETIFGEFMEQLAIFVCNQVYGGRKSSSEGIDLEFEKDGVTYLVSVKSGPNWGNSEQIKKMRLAFQKAIRTLRTNQPNINVRAVNGCCYGKESHEYGDYIKICGQEFWTFISGDERLYLDIIEPLGHRAKERNEDFQKEYARIVNLFTEEFTKDFCRDGYIDWEKLVEFNSGKQQSSRKQQ